MASTYDVGDKPTLTATFSDGDGAAQDPTAVVAIVTDPSGNDVGYHYGLSDQGTWDASTNTPSLANGTGTAGHYYTVLVAGSVDFGNGSITFTTDDVVYYNGDVWLKLPNVSTTNLTKDSTGVYTIAHYIDEAGVWRWRSEGVGTGQSAGESYFHAREQRVS